MWCVARRATYIGAASWLFDAVRLTAVADVPEPLIRNDTATATGSAASARLYSNSNPAASPSTNNDTAVFQNPSSPQDTSKQQQQPTKGPSDAPALKEGTHFAVLASDGSSSKLAAVAAAMRQADVVLLGEYHDDAVAHALQLALLKHVANRFGYPTGTQAAQQRPPQSTGPMASHKTKQPQQQPTSPQTSQMPLQQQQQQTGQPSRPLILSLEMFETDVQPVLSEYVAGFVPLSDLMKDGRPWSNYMHDYHHLVEVCKQLQLPVVAANAPRRYVSLAGRAGSKALLGLPAAAKQCLPPLPHTPSSEAYIQKVQQNMQQAAADLDAFKSQQDLLQQQRNKEHSDGPQGSHHKQQKSQQQKQQQPVKQQEQSASVVDSQGCPYIGLTVSSNFLAAQSLWDATMAYSIAGALQQHQQQQGTEPSPCNSPQLLATAATAAAAAPHTVAADAAEGRMAAGGSEVLQQSATSGSFDGAIDRSMPQGPLVVHVCGKFHCEHRLGIPEHLATYAPDAKVLVVVFTPADTLAVSQDEAATAGLLGAADFVVLTDSKVPRSFVVGHPV